MNRKPPKKVVQELRREVGFSCPICASPFLTWHHFSPTWREKQHHNPKGMIALCPEHAAQADGGHFTVKQQQNLKCPLSIEKVVSAKWPWQPEKALFVLGNSFLIGARPVLSLRGKKLLSIRKSALPPNKSPFFSFQADIRDPSGSKLLEIEDNVLTFYGAKLNDVCCPPQARSFELSHESGVKLTMRHHRLSSDKIIEKYLLNDSFKLSLLSAESEIRDSDGLIPVVEVRGYLETEDVELTLGKKSISLKCKFYNDEIVTLPSKIYHEGGCLVLSFGKEEIIKFG
ncbi:hypothetical protein [Vibrio cyclitrophicus]|uniref:hypothetical protein n=1 Tax=Vibrio cyclitrophicus TaxID=47951 RepID=UPI000C829002|nr:hypothetical protein [Vibrio cyclitrophicus]PMF43201.1 hypothetical protein BCV14_20130 [Vibrio cyclitrophicus]